VGSPTCRLRPFLAVSTLKRNGLRGFEISLRPISFFQGMSSPGSVGGNRSRRSTTPLLRPPHRPEERLGGTHHPGRAQRPGTASSGGDRNDQRTTKVTAGGTEVRLQVSLFFSRPAREMDGDETSSATISRRRRSDRSGGVPLPSLGFFGEMPRYDCRCQRARSKRRQCKDHFDPN